MRCDEQLHDRPPVCVDASSRHLGEGVRDRPRPAYKSDIAALALTAESPLHLPCRVALGHRLALVALAATGGEAELHLHPAVLEVEAEGDERQAFLRHAGSQLGDL